MRQSASGNMTGHEPLNEYEEDTLNVEMCSHDDNAPIQPDVEQGINIILNSGKLCTYANLDTTSCKTYSTSTKPGNNSDIKKGKCWKQDIENHRKMAELEINTLPEANTWNTHFEPIVIVITWAAKEVNFNGYNVSKMLQLGSF